MRLLTGIFANALFICSGFVGAQAEPEPHQSPQGNEANAPHYYRQVEPGKSKLIMCDVAIYGGTPAGVTAAVQAARAGKKAMLLSFNRHVGGMTSGLTALINRGLLRNSLRHGAGRRCPSINCINCGRASFRITSIISRGLCISWQTIPGFHKRCERG